METGELLRGVEKSPRVLSCLLSESKIALPQPLPLVGELPGRRRERHGGVTFPAEPYEGRNLGAGVGDIKAGSFKV